MTSDGSGTTGSGSELIESPIHVDELALGLLAVFITFVGVDVLLGIGEPRAAFAFVFFAVVPGTLLLTLLGYGTRAELPWLLYAVGVSLLVIMVVGFLLNLVLPPFGIERPFQELQIGIAHTLLVSGLALAIRRTDPDGRRITVPDNKAREEWLSRWFRPTTQILLLLPLFAILSVT